MVGLGVELSRVRERVEFIIGRGDRIVLGEIGLTPRAKKVIELAVDEARRLNHHYIGTEHLLLGLVREGEGIAAGTLESLGINLEKVRVQTIQILSAPNDQPAPVRETAPSNEAASSPQTPPSEPNFFILLGLDPDALWDEKQFEQALETKRNEWSLMSNKGIGARRDEAKKNLRLISQIRKVMADQDKRSEQAKAAKEELKTSKKENDRDRFNKFTERARRVLFLAQEEAQRFQHNYIGDEHLLLGLVLLKGKVSLPGSLPTSVSNSTKFVLQLSLLLGVVTGLCWVRLVSPQEQRR